MARQRRLPELVIDTAQRLRGLELFWHGMAAPELTRGIHVPSLWNRVSTHHTRIVQAERYANMVLEAPWILEMRRIVMHDELPLDARQRHYMITRNLHGLMKSTANKLLLHDDGKVILRLAAWATWADAFDFTLKQGLIVSRGLPSRLHDENGREITFRSIRRLLGEPEYNYLRSEFSLILSKRRLVFPEWAQAWPPTGTY